MSWSEFRNCVVGAKIPLEPDSLRGRLQREWKQLGLTGPCDITNNGIHASASPLESLAERNNWLGTTLEEDDFYATLLAKGVRAADLKEWMLDPLVLNADGTNTSLFDALESLDATEYVEKALQLGAEAHARSSAWAEQLASRLIDEATTAEAQVTPLLKSVAQDIGGELACLKHRLKTHRSLVRKLRASLGGALSPDMMERCSRDPAAFEQDVLRYTVTIPTDTYVSGVKTARQLLGASAEYPLTQVFLAEAFLTGLNLSFP